MSQVRSIDELNDRIPADPEEPRTSLMERLPLSRRQFARLASLVGFLILWELGGRVNPTFLSYPTEIVQAGREILFVNQELTRAFGESLWGLTVGFAIACAMGISLGFIMAGSRVIDIALLPYVNALYATPRIALIPLLVLWVGIQFELRVTIVVLSSIFPMILTIRDGALGTADDYLDVARCFVASRWQTWKTTILPGSLPYVFAALRIGIRRALIAVIVAEMAASVAGTGRLLLEYGKFFQTDKLLVPVIIIGLFSILLTSVLKWLRNAVTPWQQTE